jgi:transcriptional regulator with XRE-family HTH domain
MFAMAVTTLDLDRHATAPQLADVIRDARTLIGWTQRELAARAGTSQATVSRLESGRMTRLDLATVARILVAMGMDADLVIEGRHLADRRRQHDAVHARLTGHVARRLERAGWTTATEVPLGEGAPRGWIDLLAYRPTDRSLLVEETKTDIPDMGAMQRSVAFYQREAWAAARGLGWHPVRSSVLVVTLDSASIARRLADNRDLVTRAFPAPILDARAWLEDPTCPVPQGWAIGTCDPADRGSRWLRATMLGSRRRPPAYEDYAQAAARLLRS